MLVQRLFFAFLFIISTIFFVASFELSMMAPGGLLGAGFFPQIISGIVALLTLIYLLLTFRKSNVKKEEPKSKSKIKIPVQLLFCGGLIVTLLLINILGMLVSLGIFMIATLKWLEKMSWVRSVGFSIATMLLVYLVFVLWLDLVMPTGIFS